MGDGFTVRFGEVLEVWGEEEAGKTVSLVRASADATSFPQGSDTVGYDEYVEGVEADETASLETPLKEVAAKTALAEQGVDVWAGVLSLCSPPFPRATWASDSFRRWAGTRAQAWASSNKVGEGRGGFR